MRLILTLALATRLASNALAQMPDTVTQATVTTRLTVDGLYNARPVRFFDRSDSSRATHHLRHALVGAGVGAAVGIAAGVVYPPVRGVFGVSCGNSACTHQKSAIILFTLTLDAGIGAGVGGFLGALVP